MGGTFVSRKRKTWSEYKEWVDKLTWKKKNMVGIQGMGEQFDLEKEKHGQNIRNGWTI